MNRIVSVISLLLVLLCSAGIAQAQDVGEQFSQLLSEAEEAYAQAVGYRLGDEIPLVPEQLSSNASDEYEGQNLACLLDDKATTFWHSDWHGRVSAPHYIQIDLDSPVSCDLSLHVVRRRSSYNHPTRMGLYVSNDQRNWTRIGQFLLGNASFGEAYTSHPLSLGGVPYAHLRLSIEETSDGNIFGHFAELRLLRAECVGPSYMSVLGPIAVAFRRRIGEAAEALASASVTEELLAEFQQAYDGFVAELGRAKSGLMPSLRQYSDLPSLFIGTYDGNPVTGKTSYQMAKLMRLDGDSLAVYDSVKVRGRGNSTWTLAKKPYRIKFSAKQRFLGKGHAKAKSWTLLANHADKTLLRNALASFLARRLGQTFVPSAVHVDVALNGEYIGNYQISDHMEVHKGRVEITEQNDVVTDDTADISGGYLLQLDGMSASDPSVFETDMTRGLVSVKSPDEDVISDRQFSYIRDYVNAFERTLLGNNFADPERGYRQLVDSLSLASYFLTVELTANPDGFYSVYFYKEREDPHFYWGPCWDYDIAFNNCRRLGDILGKMMKDTAYGEKNGRRWFGRFWSDPWFQQLCGRTWHRAVAEGLTEDALAFVDSVAQRIERSQQLNFQRWDITQKTWDELVLFSTYQQGVDYLKQFLVDRTAFLSSLLPNPEGLLPPRLPAANPLGLDLTRAYYIYNVGTDLPIDICSDGSANLFLGERNAARKASQQWRIVPVAADYYRIVSPGSKLAIADLSPWTAGSFSSDTQLQLAETNETDDRQLWRFVPTESNYSIENKRTGLVWGKASDGASQGGSLVASCHGAANGCEQDCQWYIMEGDELPDEDAIALLQGDIDYRITYDAMSQQVFVRIPSDARNRQGVIRLLDLQGRCLDTGAVGQPISMAGLPRGIYLLSWTVQGHSHSLKFLKP